MNLVDYPNHYVVFSTNLCIKLMAGKRVLRIKQWWINENSLWDSIGFCMKTILSSGGCCRQVDALYRWESIHCFYFTLESLVVAHR